ncbi:unnamed protein product [Dibothriocephalus latus]|uniref:Uncharacterized protein n=1 Tax=Dibothriocephalus latus TaxID=60516 RepID=A0A3P7PBH0_DIBLA|nr:unnamed protein product [Dibothriocephalus latus]
MGDERTLFTLPDILRDIPDSRIIQMRERIRFIWSTYFSSLRSIIMTTLEVLVIWQCDLLPPSERHLSELFGRETSVWLPPAGSSRDGHETVSLSDRFLPVSDIPTLAVWSLELSSTNLTSTAMRPFYFGLNTLIASLALTLAIICGTRVRALGSILLTLLRRSTIP